MWKGMMYVICFKYLIPCKKEIQLEVGKKMRPFREKSWHYLKLVAESITLCTLFLYIYFVFLNNNNIYTHYIELISDWKILSYSIQKSASITASHFHYIFFFIFVTGDFHEWFTLLSRFLRITMPMVDIDNAI